MTSTPLVHKGAWHLLPITPTPAMLPTTTEHFDRAAYAPYGTTRDHVGEGEGSFWTQLIHLDMNTKFQNKLYSYTVQ